MSEPPRSGQSKKVRRSSPRRALVATLVVLGGTVVGVSMVLGMYVVQAASATNCTHVTETLYPWWVTVSSKGSSCPASESGSFSQAGLPLTGDLYLVATALALCAVAFALLFGWLIFKGGRAPRSRALAVVGVVAILAGGLAATVLAVEQPATVCSDQGFRSPPLEFGTPDSNLTAENSTSGAVPACNSWSFWSGSGTGNWWLGASGPWNSFVGRMAGGGYVFAWSPGLGWFLELWGVGLTSAGIAIAWRGAQRESFRDTTRTTSR
jgi:hypothetical protein